MSRFLLAGLLVLGFTVLASAQDPETTEGPSAPVGSEADEMDLKQLVIENPDDVKGLQKYILSAASRIRKTSVTDSKAAETQVDELQTFLNTLKPTDAAATRLLASGGRYLQSLKKQIVLSRLSLEDITAALEKNPNDLEAVENYGGKIGMMIRPIVRKDPAAAEKLMDQGRTYLEALAKRTEEKETNAAIESALETLEGYTRSIENGKELLALIGTEAVKLDVKAWVNGEPLTEEDLKGKVVLLDFWAVWCGPCIAAFPHLRDWSTKHEDLVIIGVTKYYEYAWNEQDKKPKKNEGISEEDEQEMLLQFAKHHNLTHRFAVQVDRNLSQHYAVQGIPQVVLIDREGKVRLIRVGSGEENAKEIEDMIQKLIAK